MGQPDTEGWKENCATVTASFVWNGVTENVGVLLHYSTLVGVTLFFEGWIIQLPTQYYFQIAFYNKNAKYSIMSPIFSSVFEVNVFKGLINRENFFFLYSYVVKLLFQAIRLFFICFSFLPILFLGIDPFTHKELY